MKNKLFISLTIGLLVLLSLFFLFKENEETYEIYNTNSPSRVKEVNLIVSDVDKLSTFYQQVMTNAVFACNPISFLIASEDRPLALASNNFPNKIKVINTALVSK